MECRHNTTFYVEKKKICHTSSLDDISKYHFYEPLWQFPEENRRLVIAEKRCNLLPINPSH